VARTRSLTSSHSTTSDYVLIAIAFAEDAVADRKRERSGQWVRLAAKRFLADLRKANRRRPPFLFSAARANHACKFIERLPHVEGTWDSPTIVLEPFQVFFVVGLFGFRNLNGGRRFTYALLAIARKNAKSTLAAAILLYVLCCESEIGPQLYSAATTGTQARIVWNIARRMVDRLPALQAAFDLETFANAIARYEVGGTFKPINAKASTQDGLNPSALVLDELHAHKTHDLRNVLVSAAGGRPNPLFLFTTTEGYESPGPWAEERNFAHKVLQGVIKAEHYWCVLFALDDEDDDFEPRTWVKANPLLPSNPNLAAAIAREAIEAKQKPGAFAEFRIKRLNRRSETARGWINLTRWRKCGGAVELASLEGSPCWGAFDLASNDDLTAWRLLWLKDGMFYTWGRQWVPADVVKSRTERGTAPYGAWINAGFVEVTDGNATDYNVVQARILEDCNRFAPLAVGYDTWGARQMAMNLADFNVPLCQFAQTTRNFSPAMKACEHAYTTGHLRHAGDLVLTWCASNLVPITDGNMNVKPDKKRSADKIDAMVALLMCFGLAEAREGGDVAGFLANPIVA
jgi:phage terminase large subunit-like protein